MYAKNGRYMPSLQASRSYLSLLYIVQVSGPYQMA